MKLKNLLLSIAVAGTLTATADDIPACQLITADPVAGTAMDFPGSEPARVYTFNTNINAYVGFAEGIMFDVAEDPEDPSFFAYMEGSHTLGSDDPIVIKSGDVYNKMLAGHEYRLTITLYDKENSQLRQEVGQFSILYKGAAEEYKYSDIKAISVNPNPDTYMIEDSSEAHFTVSFSGAVEIDQAISRISHGVMGTVPYASITPNDNKTEWTFVIPDAELSERVINCFVVAKDSDGRPVRGNADMEEWQSGSGDNAGFMFTYQSQLAGDALVVTPGAGKVDELNEFIVTSETGWPVMALSWTAFPELMKDKELIYTFTSDDIKITGGKATITVPKRMIPTVAGRYQLVFPFGCFMFQLSADDQGGTTSKHTVISYILGEEPVGEVTLDLKPESITPEAGEVKEIKNVDIHFAQDVNLMLYDAYILNAEGGIIAKADIGFDDDMDNLTDYHVVFDPAITAVGTYTFYIPKESFGDMAYADSNARMGQANDDIRVSYTINVGVSAAAIEAENGIGDVYTMTGVCVMRNATAADLNSLDKGVYLFNGKKIVK